VQVDPIQLNLKPPGTEHLKLKCDDPFSNFASNFNLCHCIKALDPDMLAEVGRCWLTR